ncbi:putative dynactin arp1 p62 subunit ro2 protein [Phaeoacremonium minimum UCRPA7]|uniref:Dynactin subunit 4 n=1 Tax=Phaeoacremonium minimum (strain UCR-PA7) TaxID=1286976 RepID=R8BF10_PHAM7|nr:putative dynactin arp1 p62 subunit ro2 protein [Phaeoacremonium minimum UCRPA7]EON97877.1 putative dynactin arp1 p62 subunit ro2 protein [Phaeoacremonium minimum UCRPA7]
MAPMSPYTFIQCPCSDPSTILQADASSPTQAELDDDDRTFDPRAPRSNYSLYPLEYLLYCEDCHQIRCPRCVAEEIVTYYCPNCLFEVPGSNIKSEGNRCTRSCFQCPICIGPLSVTNLESAPDPKLLVPENASTTSGPYVLTCSYCNWSSTEIGIKFDKPNGIYSQLQKIRNGGKTRLTPKERKDKRKDASSGSALASISETPKEVVVEGDLDIETQFANLKAFYQSQLAQTNPAGPGLSALGDLGFSSPGSLSRIMSLYTGGSLVDKKAKSRAGTMREALEADEGLRLANLDEQGAIHQLQQSGWDGTVTADQLSSQPPNVGEIDLYGRSRFADELRPIPYLLRTKRSKRCPICRHIISKPEAKVATTRFRIRLVAGSYIPSITIRPLTLPTSSSTGAINTPTDLLAPLKPVQYLLTFKNPIFETIKVTLATPATTPGRFASKVTVLCPQFEIDANTDVWDEALKDGEKERRRRRGEEGQHQAEAGKIWERGRNWVSIVVEVVPASLRLDTLALMKKDGEDIDLGPLRTDEDILEIPMFVRVEWEADAAHDEVGAAPGKDKEAREKREMAYWCVLGIGRISQD